MPGILPARLLKARREGVNAELSDRRCASHVGANAGGRDHARGCGSRHWDGRWSGPTLYVDNQISGTVTPISTVTNTPGRSINTGRGPTNMEITPDGKTLYVANQASGTVTPISATTNTAGKPIKTGNIPWSIVCAPKVCRSSSTAG